MTTPDVTARDLIHVDDVPPGSVVVGVDGSPGSDTALDWAAGTAQRERRLLALLHASEPRPFVTDELGGSAQAAGLQDAIDRAARALVADRERRVREQHPDLRTVRVVVDADPRSAMVAAAERAHLVVAGARGRGRVTGMPVGSVSSFLARSAPGPVVVVPAPAASSHVTVAADGTPESRAVVELGYEQAALRGLPLHVLHCYWPSLGVDAGEKVTAEQERLLLGETVAGLGEKYPEVDVTLDAVVTPAPVETIVERSGGSALLVLGRHPRQGLMRSIYGSLVTGIVERAGCPVAVVPASVA